MDVEDEETTGEVSKNPDLSTLYMLQVVSKAIDISLAKVRLTMMVNINRCVRMFFSVKLAKAAVGCYVLHVCV